MKQWQKGIDIDTLLDIEQFYSKYNDYALSPFTEVKRHRIADSIVAKEHRIYEHCGKNIVMFNQKMNKVKTPIKMYKDVILGIKEPGDVVITSFEWDRNFKQKAIDILSSIKAPTWIYVWAEDKQTCSLLEEANYDWIGSKITSMAEVIAIYFSHGINHSLFPTEKRIHPSRTEIEDYGIKQANVEPYNVDNIIHELSNLDVKFTNHYSNYNKNKSWSALSLRGYSPDIGFITKPEEMNDKWKKEHENDTFFMQDTELRTKINVEHLLSLLPTENFHRIRLMKLAKGNGELTRHTDQVDPDSGTTDGKLLRFHFPIITNPQVIFSSWDAKGNKNNVHMKSGECWYLDTRKPHSAVNFGDTDRIHLVVDVESNEKLRRLINNVL